MAVRKNSWIFSVFPLGLLWAVHCRAPEPSPYSAPQRPSTELHGAQTRVRPDPTTTRLPDPIQGQVEFVEVLTGDPSPTIPRANILAIHGYGDTPQNFVQWLRPLRANARIWAARGVEQAGEGRAWFPRSNADFNGAAPAMKVSAIVLEQAFRSRMRRDNSCGAPLIVGFSQGAMLAYVIAATQGNAYNTVIPIGGLLPSALLPSPQMRGSVQIHAFHGTADAMIPFAEGERSLNAFHSAGFTTNFHALPGVGHTIPPQTQAEILGILERAIRALPCP